jgi:hypothetical protein
MDTTGRGVGVYASANAGNAVAAAVWANGIWGVPAVVSASAVARSTPYVDATGSSIDHVVYQDATYHYDYLACTGTWSSPQAIGSAGNHYFGPFAATIAATGSAEATVSFFDGTTGMANPTNTVTTSDLVAGAWESKTAVLNSTPNVVGDGSNDVIPAAIITLAGETDQMLVYVDNHSAIQSLTRTGPGGWSAPAAIVNCFTDDPVALAPLSAGGAILAFRGQDGKLYWTVYSATGASWSQMAPFSTLNVTVDTAPAVVHGIASDTAEIAYVSGGAAYHARLQGSTWSTPVLVGGSGLTGVAIAAAP